MGDKQKFAFDKTNFILLAIGMAVVILGYDIWRDAQAQNKRIRQDGMV